MLFGRLSNGGTVRVVLESEDGKDKLGFTYLSREEEKATPKPPKPPKPRKGPPGPPSGAGAGGTIVPRVSRRPTGRKSEPAA